MDADQNISFKKPLKNKFGITIFSQITFNESSLSNRER